MVTWHRLGPILVATPGGAVAIDKFTISAIDVHIIAKYKHSAGDVIEQLSSGFIVVVITRGNISRADQDSRIPSSGILICCIQQQKYKNNQQEYREQP